MEDDVEQGTRHEGLVEFKRSVLFGQQLGARRQADHRRHQNGAHAGRRDDDAVPGLEQPPDQQADGDPVQDDREGERGACGSGHQGAAFQERVEHHRCHTQDDGEVVGVLGQSAGDLLDHVQNAPTRDDGDQRCDLTLEPDMREDLPGHQQR